MKSGAADPFAEDEVEGTVEEASTQRRRKGRSHDWDGSSEDGSDDTDTPAPRTDEESADDRDEVDSSTPDDADDDLTRSALPYVLRRDKVKEERPEVHQLFVQEATHDAAVDAERDLADRFEDDLSRTDAREAIYLAGMNHLDEAEAILREWGYDF